MLNFFKWAYPSLCFSIFVSAILYNLRVNFRQCSDLNHGPLVSEANTLPTVPQPLPQQFIKLDDGFNKTQEKCFRYFFLQSFASETKLWFTFRPQEKNSIFFRWLITSWWRHRFLSRPKKFLLLRSKVTSLLKLRCTVEKLRKARGRLFAMVFWWHYVNSPTDNSSPDNSSPLFIPHRGFWGACSLVRA